MQHCPAYLRATLAEELLLMARAVVRPWVQTNCCASMQHCLSRHQPQFHNSPHALPAPAQSKPGVPGSRGQMGCTHLGCRCCAVASRVRSAGFQRHSEPAGGHGCVPVEQAPAPCSPRHRTEHPAQGRWPVAPRADCLACGCPTCCQLSITIQEAGGLRSPPATPASAGHGLHVSDLPSQERTRWPE